MDSRTPKVQLWAKQFILVMQCDHSERSPYDNIVTECTEEELLGSEEYEKVLEMRERTKASRRSERKGVRVDLC